MASPLPPNLKKAYAIGDSSPNLSARSSLSRHSTSTTALSAVSIIAAIVLAIQTPSLAFLQGFLLPGFSIAAFPANCVWGFLAVSVLNYALSWIQTPEAPSYTGKPEETSKIPSQQPLARAPSAELAVSSSPRPATTSAPRAAPRSGGTLQALRASATTAGSGSPLLRRALRSAADPKPSPGSYYGQTSPTVALPSSSPILRHRSRRDASPVRGTPGSTSSPRHVRSRLESTRAATAGCQAAAFTQSFALLHTGSADAGQAGSDPGASPHRRTVTPRVDGPAYATPYRASPSHTDLLRSVTAASHRSGERGSRFHAAAADTDLDAGPDEGARPGNTLSPYFSSPFGAGATDPARSPGGHSNGGGAADGGGLGQPRSPTARQTSSSALTSTPDGRVYADSRLAADTLRRFGLAEVAARGAVAVERVLLAHLATTLQRVAVLNRELVEEQDKFRVGPDVLSSLLYFRSATVPVSRVPVDCATMLREAARPTTGTPDPRFLHILQERADLEQYFLPPHYAHTRCYVFQRLSALAGGGAPRVLWNAGAPWRGRAWSERLPTDALLLLQCFLCMMEAEGQHRPPRPAPASAPAPAQSGFGFGAPSPAPASGFGFGFGSPAPAPAPASGFGFGLGSSSAASSGFGFGSQAPTSKAFTDAPVVQASTSFSDVHLHIDEDHDGSKLSDHLRIVIVLFCPLHLKLLHNGRILEVAPGPENLAHTILLFLHLERDNIVLQNREKLYSSLLLDGVRAPTLHA